MTAPLNERVALVTGGTRGIGEAIARRLLRDGARVIVTGHAARGSAPEGCEYRGVDLSDVLATEAFAQEMGKIGFDIVVNNAGVNAIDDFERIKLEDFDRIHRVNVRAPFLLSRACIPSMRTRGCGRIVNIASVFGVVSREQRGSYSTSKFAIDGMTAALAAEVASHGILANCVSPGFIETDMTRSILGERGMTELAARIPIRRLGKPDEVAALVAWLAGPENTYVSGQNFIVDGGFTRV